MQNISTTPRVYSYIRFSTPDQALGDSERRQLDAARSFAKRIGRELDESLQPDRGLSGYKGDHRKKGMLGQFLRNVEAGQVPNGSILVVEKVSRLSREGVYKTLKEVVFDLLKAGITIQVLDPEIAFDEATLEGPLLHVLIALLQSAFQESKDKSYFGQKNWQQKRKDAYEAKKILTRRCPAWLTITESKFQPIQEAAETIRQIFDLKLKGIGIRTIEQKLNVEATWKPPLFKNPKKRKSGSWRASYIKKILVNRAVIGEYQPHERTSGKRLPVGEPISDYYPAIVESAVFNAVQGKLQQSKGRTGRTEKANNLLVYLVTCAYCSGPMRFLDKGRKGGKVLVCDNGRRKVHQDGKPVCSRHSIRYDECANVVLENCYRLRPEQVLPNPDEQAKLVYTMQQRVEGRAAELQRIEDQIDNFTDQIGTTKDRGMRERYEARVKQLDERKRSIQAEKTDNEKELAKAQQALKSFTNWKRNLETLQKALQTEDVVLRQRLRAHLREFIDKLEIFAVGHPEMYDSDKPIKHRWDRDGEELAREFFDKVTEVNPELADSDEFHAFLDHVTERRMSKQGRFIRVHFKTGPTVDLVPVGSIASGSVWIRAATGKQTWQFSDPNIEELWKDFTAKRAGRRRRDRPKVQKAITS